MKSIDFANLKTTFDRIEKLSATRIIRTHLDVINNIIIMTNGYASNWNFKLSTRLMMEWTIFVLSSKREQIHDRKFDTHVF